MPDIFEKCEGFCQEDKLEKCFCEEWKAKQEDNRKRSAGIFCRSVGPGGTSIDFKSMENGVRCVWENENCPYITREASIEFYKNNGLTIVTADEESVASDEHNVSWLSYEEMHRLLQYAIEKGWYTTKNDKKE